jgi:hypothetical protein
MTEIDLKAAINAVSDVVQNRPRPIREFDQIYMKTGIAQRVGIRPMVREGAAHEVCTGNWS